MNIPQPKLKRPPPLKRRKGIPTVKRSPLKENNGKTTKIPVRPTVKRPPENTRKGKPIVKSSPLKENNGKTTKKPVRPTVKRQKPRKGVINKNTPSPKGVSLNDPPEKTRKGKPTVKRPKPRVIKKNTPSPKGVSLNGPPENTQFGTSLNDPPNTGILAKMIRNAQEKLRVSSKKISNKKENRINEIIQRVANAKLKAEKERENQSRKNSMSKSKSKVVKMGNLNKMISNEQGVIKAIKTFANRKAENKARQAENKARRAKDLDTETAVIRHKKNIANRKAENKAEHKSIQENDSDNDNELAFIRHQKTLANRNAENNTRREKDLDNDNDLDTEMAFIRHQKTLRGANLREKLAQERRKKILELRRLSQKKRERFERNKMRKEDPSSMHAEYETTENDNSDSDKSNEDLRKNAEGEEINTDDELPEGEEDILQMKQREMMDENKYNIDSIRNRIIQNHGDLFIQNIPVIRFIDEKMIEVDEKIQQNKLRPATPFELYTFLECINDALEYNSRIKHNVDNLVKYIIDMQNTYKDVTIEKNRVEDIIHKTLDELHKTSMKKLGRPPSRIEQYRLVAKMNLNIRKKNPEWEPYLENIMNKYWEKQPFDEKMDRIYDLDNIMNNFWAKMSRLELDPYEDEDVSNTNMG